MPPQSTSLSLPLATLSVQLGQGNAQLPPQSTPVSPAFCMLS
jgi:hypothetical protein